MLNPFDRFNSDITAQQVFDHVVFHLSTMEKPSKAVPVMRDPESWVPQDDEGCAYRGSGGSCCAAGYLLASHEYRQDMEAKTFAALDYKIPLRLRPHRTLISDLQDAHDTEWNWEGAQMFAALDDVAESHNLDGNIIRALKWPRINP